MADFIQKRNIIDYLPDFMKQFTEIREIMQAETLEFRRINSKMQSLVDNAFIMDADEHGISRYESMLKLVPNADDTLDDRKSRVLLFLNNKLPYTYRILIQKLNTLCGIDNFDLYPDFDNYGMDLFIYSANYDEVYEFLDGLLPMNINYEVHSASKNIANNYIGMLWQDDEVIEFKEVV